MAVYYPRKCFAVVHAVRTISTILLRLSPLVVLVITSTSSCFEKASVTINNLATRNGPAKLMCSRSHGCSRFGQWNNFFTGRFWNFWNEEHSATVLSMSLLMLDYQACSPAKLFMRTMPSGPAKSSLSNFSSACCGNNYSLTPQLAFHSFSTISFNFLLEEILRAGLALSDHPDCVNSNALVYSWSLTRASCKVFVSTGHWSTCPE